MVCTSFLRRSQQPMATGLKAFPNMGQAVFGLKCRGGRVTAMAVTHKVKIISPNGTKEFRCSENDYILDAAENHGMDLPYTCRVGGCSTCIGKVIKGKVAQPDNTYLDDDQIKDGYILTCIAYAKSDVVIESHKEGEFVKKY
ncbi:hypothetical protein RIF29_42183 [Crotalaria pallida]|uniref:Ferredoxin n=1 Tax=Crotalaria pallida TaxID=3830 RepID=A0AAN9E8N9_CROPI